MSDGSIHEASLFTVMREIIEEIGLDRSLPDCGMCGREVYPISAAWRRQELAAPPQETV
ncbi:MAG: hypothetical protein AB7Q45_25755 [Planctomycetaceae bacterium]